VVLPTGQEAWALTRHADIRAMLTDPRFSADRTRPGFPSMVAEAPQPARRRALSLIAMDPPEHGTARREVMGEFTVRRLEELRPRIQQIVDEHIAAMLDGPQPADLVQALSLPVPSLVICELLGVPYDDHDFFQSRSSALFSHSNSLAERGSAMQELQSYLHEMVSRKEEHPTDDLLGRQVIRQRETGELSHADLVGLGFLLLIAGHETTANMISLGTLAFLERPEAIAAIRDDPARTPAVVEELLRYFTIADSSIARVAAEDVEIAGVRIRAGEGVLALGYAGNTDPEVFPEPHELDVSRSARHHLAFGFGPHQCLGQNLARIELQIVFDTLFRLIPDLTLAARVEDLSFKNDASAYGIYALPVTW
jgi:cytochrome P450